MRMEIQRAMRYVACKMDGVQCYAEDIVLKEVADVLKDNNLVVIFGVSDDIIEFRGVIKSEIIVRNGDFVYLNCDGLLPCSKGCSQCQYRKESCDKTFIEVCRSFYDPCSGEIAAWSYKTDVLHRTFRVFENNQLFCTGMVFWAGCLPSSFSPESKIVCQTVMKSVK